MSDLTEQGHALARGLRQGQVREKSLALGPALEYYDDLLALSDDQTADGQVRLAYKEGNLYYRLGGEWKDISPLNLYGFRQVDVVNIDDPAELEQEVPRGKKREIIVARQSSGSATLYRYDFGTAPAGLVSPLAVRSAHADGFWAAMGGRYSVGEKNVLGPEDLAAIGTTSDDTALWVGGIIQYDVQLTWGDDPAAVMESYTPSVSVPVESNGNQYSLVLWTIAVDTATLDSENASIQVGLSSGGLVSFAPSSIVGIAMWIDANDSTSFTETAGRVSQITNKANESKNITQGTAAQRPIRVADSFAPRVNGVSYTSPCNMVGPNGWTGNSEIVIALAFKNDRLLNGAGTTDGLFAIALDNNNYISLGTQDGGAIVGRIGTAGGTHSVYVAGSFAIGTVNIISLYLSGIAGQMRLFHNGITENAAMANSPSGISASASVRVGMWWASGAFASVAEGDIGDIIVATRTTVFAQDEIDNITNYLKFKYGGDF